MATPAEQMRLEHEQAEGHHVTVEDVPDEDLKPHTSTDSPGKENAPTPSSAKKPVKLDIQSEELFPSLGDSKKQGPATWGSNKTPASETNGSQASAPSRSSVPIVQLPGRAAHVEAIILQTQELKPQSELKRPLAQILKDISTRRGVKIVHKPTPRGQRFEAEGPQLKAQDALKELVKEIGSTVCPALLSYTRLPILP